LRSALYPGLMCRQCGNITTFDPSRINRHRCQQHQSHGLDRRRLPGQQRHISRLCAGCRRNDHDVRPSGSIQTEALSINRAGSIVDTTWTTTTQFNALCGLPTNDHGVRPFGSIQTEPSASMAGDRSRDNYESDQPHGFVRAADGTITTFDPSGSIQTEALSNQSQGSIAGYYVDSNSTAHGFVRAADGTITTVRPVGISRHLCPQHQSQGLDYGILRGQQSAAFHGLSRACRWN